VAGSTQPGRSTPIKNPLHLEAATRRALLYFGAGLGALVLTGILPVPWSHFTRGYVDFLQLYTGAVLVGTDGLYSVAANREMQLRLIGHTLESVYYVRLPFYAALLRPLTLLPYQAAYWVFQLVSIAAAIVFARLCRGPWQLTAAILLFLPLTVSILVGQDITIVVALCAATILLCRSGRDAAAGFVLSLCIIKFHLFVLVPLVLVRHRKWSMIGGAAGGVLIWLAISTLVAGPDWPRQYLAMLRNPAISPYPDYMPTVRGIFLGWPSALYATALVLAVLLYVIAKQRNFEVAFGVALAGGLLLNTHSYLQDCAILLPALVSAVKSGRAGVRRIALFLMTPIPYVLLMLGHGAVFLFCVLALAVMRTAAAARAPGDQCAA
jgi:hypothetical protein